MPYIKYFETVTNARGDALANYRVQVVDSAGAEVELYADSAGTRFTDGAGNTVNYTTAASNGKAEFYWTPATGQVLQVLDTNGNLVDSTADFADKYVIGNLPGSIGQDVVTDLVVDLAAKAEIATLASNTAGQGASGVGLEGAGTVQQALKVAATPAALLALNTAFGTGAMLRTEDGHRYKVVASGGNLTTAGGVQLQILPDDKGEYQFEAAAPATNFANARLWAIALPAGSVLNIEGSYTSDSTLIFTNKIIVRGKGKLTLRAGGPATMVELRGDRSEWWVELDGNKDNITSGTPVGIYVVGAERCKIGARVWNAKGNGVWAAAAPRTQIMPSAEINFNGENGVLMTNGSSRSIVHDGADLSKNTKSNFLSTDSGGTACDYLRIGAADTSEASYYGRPLTGVTIFSTGSGYTTATALVVPDPRDTGFSGTTATVTPNIVSGQITSYTVTNPGSGYRYPPEIQITGDGTGAVAKGTPEYQCGTQIRITKGTLVKGLISNGCTTGAGLAFFGKSGDENNSPSREYRAIGCTLDGNLDGLIFGRGSRSAQSIGNSANDNIKDGIDFNGTAFCTSRGDTTLRNGEKNFLVWGGSNWTIRDLTSLDANQAQLAANDSGLNVQDMPALDGYPSSTPTYGRIIGGRMSDTQSTKTQPYGIRLGPSASNITIEKVDVRGNLTAGINDASGNASSNIKRGNPGYKTETTCVATITAGNTSVVVGSGTTGLVGTGVTIQQVSVTPTGTPISGYAGQTVSAIGTQGFTVNIPAALGSDISFTCTAKIYSDGAGL